MPLALCSRAQRPLLAALREIIARDNLPNKTVKERVERSEAYNVVQTEYGGTGMVAGETKLFVGVVGDGLCTAETAAVAVEVGALLAERGCAVVCGGLGGVMEAACRGARSRGGLAIGILPGDDRGLANPYVTVPIVTGLGEARNVLVVKTSQVVIAVEGRYGTLSEIALALKLGVPVVGLNTWHLSKGGRADEGIIRASTPAEAVDEAIRLAGARR